MQASWSVTIATHPGLGIVKTGPEEAVELGDVVQYTITVSNTGE